MYDGGMDFIMFVVLGIFAGTLGGLLGIGGSVIMIPALLFFIPDMTIHLAQAIAMTVNPAVAISSAAKHQHNLNVSWKAVWRVIPLSLVCISAAAWFSNSINGAWLEFSFALFLIWVFWDQISCFVNKNSKEQVQGKQTSLFRFGLTGGITGTVSGLLGIGGGLVQVPLLNRVCSLPIKRAIGTSSAIMFVTAIVGATVKDLSLQDVENGGLTAILFAAQIIPGALVGGLLGAKLTNALPSKTIRFVFAILVALASYKLFSASIPVLF
ncbi:MAG TPA: sulfite exporter TauE/SafE family protein [Phycisphaerales bacterium]|nr:sulfite exporter TauE/SafE family protein [Phycisphaerales bacterium]HIB51098.1 sulfite exporter TauE/SafE family protein [Phycisphaerales bacterium]HIN83548.1 sulfite exporter TauE/SafE family protein [Phycisphaerales bacterium]HIO19728.1 sulfite exporter TauE/SafE family protein [Phycisphaerales bacterium]HIO52066.1 sulfite exporter TauE/SafE family protein [Phycisphaerales bacterium]